MDRVTIIEDWEKIGKDVYYKWREVDEKDWHYKLTPYKEKPVVHFKTMSQKEFDEFYEGMNWMTAPLSKDKDSRDEKE